MQRSRLGFTLMEMMIVVSMIGLLTLMVLPKFSGLVERNKLNAAREEITAAIATARAAAVQKGRSATVYLTGNSIRVIVVTSNAGATTTLVPSKSLSTLYNVSLTSSSDSIRFDMRGYASPRLSATGMFKVLAGSRRDSVCVTTVGQIMPRSCSL